MNQSSTDISLQRQIEVWEEELGTWKADKDNLDRRIATRERLLRTLREESELAGPRGLFETPAPAQSNGNGTARPGTGEAVVRVLEASEMPLSASEVYAELERRGWVPLDAKVPRNAVGAALWTLAKNGKIAKLGDTHASRRWAAKTSQTQEAPGEAET